MTKMRSGISRRDFLRGSAVAIGSTAALGGLLGCSPSAAEPGSAEEAGSKSEPAITPEEVVDTGIVVAGAGISGLAAAVQAALNGEQVVLLEKNPVTGGNGVGVEGILGINTSAQKELGITVDKGELVREELSFAQWKSNGVLYSELFDASAANYDWLLEQGVLFSGVVNNYDSPYTTFHWFKDNVASSGYVPAMTSRAQDLGVDLRLETSLTGLVVENGEVVGAYASDSDGRTIQFNAKAVILATGGFGNNVELLEKLGFPTINVGLGGVPGHDGDGYAFAVAAGARDTIAHAATLSGLNIAGLDIRDPVALGLTRSPYNIWVNQEAKRLVPEDHMIANPQNLAMPLYENNLVWCVFNAEAFAKTMAGAGSGWGVDTGKTPDETLSELMASNPDENAFTADSIEELAQAAGFDAAALSATVSRYCELCSAGHDADFGKAREYLLPLESGPFYMVRLDPGILAAFGGIGTDPNMQVVSADGAPISGLFATGADGCMLYRDVYPINVPGSACAHNVNSGRVAANVACGKPAY